MRRLMLVILVLGCYTGIASVADPRDQRLQEAKMLSTLAAVVNSPRMGDDHYILQLDPSDFRSDDLRAVFAAMKELKLSGRTVNREAVNGMVGPACSPRVLEVVFSEAEVQANRRLIRHGEWELGILQSFFEKHCAGKTQDEIRDIFGDPTWTWWASRPTLLTVEQGSPDQSRMAFRWVYEDMRIKNFDRGQNESVLCIWFFYRDGYRATGFETMTLGEYQWRRRLDRP